MSLAKKIQEMFHGYYRGSGCNPLFAECERELVEELGKVVNQIRERRDKIQKVLDEEKTFRRSTAFHDYAGGGQRSFSEIELDKFRAIVRELDLVLALLADNLKGAKEDDKT